MNESRKDVVNPQEVFETVFDLVRTCTKIFEPQKYVEEMRTMEFYILLYIYLKGPQKMHELAEAYSMTRSNVTAIIDGMEKGKYVKRKRSKEDRRVIYIHLTEKGEEVGNETFANFNKVVKSFLENVPEDDYQVVTDAFQRVTRRFISEVDSNI